MFPSGGRLLKMRYPPKGRLPFALSLYDPSSRHRPCLRTTCEFLNAYPAYNTYRRERKGLYKFSAALPSGRTFKYEDLSVQVRIKNGHEKCVRHPADREHSVRLRA